MKHRDPINHTFFVFVLFCASLALGTLFAEGIFWVAMWYAGV